MKIIIDFINFLITFIFLIINLLKVILEVIFVAVRGVINVATGFCAEISVPLIILVVVAVVYKVISVGKSGE